MYDAKGNLTDDGAYEYVYDNENRLLTVCKKGASCQTLLSIEYDALGRVITRTRDSEEPIRYVYDGISYAVLQEWQDDGLGGQDLLREFIHAQAHINPVAMIDYTDAGDDPAGTAEFFYFLQDERNNVAALVDDQGALRESYVYDPYGTAYVWQGPINGEPSRVSIDPAIEGLCLLKTLSEPNTAVSGISAGICD